MFRMKKYFSVVAMCFLLVSIANCQIKKYCYTTYSGEYAMSLFNDGSGKALYQLYNSSGGLVKTMQGEWSMRDEGLYGPAYVITINWTGVNEGMQGLKFIAQFDGYGLLQGIIDSESRVWDNCN